MIKPYIYRWVFHIPLKDVQRANSDPTLENCCFLCGKKIKGEARYYVHYLNNGMLVSSEKDFSDSQGFFPIGNDCKKRLPNNFYFDK